MRIAYYSHYYAPEIGAPSARIYDLSKQWLSLGHEIQVVTCLPNHPKGELYPGYSSGLYMGERLDGIQVHRHWTYVTPNRGFIKKTIGHASYLPAALLLSNRHVAAPDVAIGTSPTFFAAMAASHTAWRKRIPFVMEVRDLWPAIFVDLGLLRNPLLIGLLERLEMALYRRATRIVTVTSEFRRNLIDRGVPECKVSAILNGADVNFWKPTEPPVELRRRLGLEDKFTVVYIGAHGISHGLAQVLEAARPLAEVPEIQFLFVGEGAEKRSLVRKAQEQQLTNVRFLDAVGKEEVRKFYALADVCLVPLRNIPLFDAFIPSKMFEIMAMGKPILGSVRGEARDILTRSGGAIVVAPEDSRAMSDALLGAQPPPLPV